MAPVPPEPITTGNTYKLTTFLNYGIQGWSESYYVNTTTDQQQLVTMKSAAQRINQARKKPLVAAATMIGQRIESQAVKRDAWPFSPPDLSLGIGANAATSAGPWQGWLLRVSDISGQVWDNRIYTGWDNASVDYATGNGWVAVVPPKVSKFYSEMEQILCFPNSTKDGMSWRYCIKSYDRTLLVSPVLDVLTVTIDGDGNVVLTLVAPQVTIFRGNTVQLSTNRAKCVRGLSGRARVLSTTGGGAVITLAKKFCCDPAELVNVIATVRVIKTAYYPIASLQLLRVVKRNRGRAFFATVGAHGGSCC